jgi:hypothetical protein
MPSINHSFVNEPSLSICLGFHCRAHRFTNFIQKVNKTCKKQWTLIRLRHSTTRTADWRHWACKHCRCARIGHGRYTGEGPLSGYLYYRSIDGSNRRLERVTITNWYQRSSEFIKLTCDLFGYLWLKMKTGVQLLLKVYRIELKRKGQPTV